MKKLVQMRLSERTLNKVEELKKVLHEENRTKLVSEGISIYLELAKAYKAGGKVYIENSNGSRERLVLTH